MEKKKIYLDYDGVLVDLHTPWLKHLNKTFNVNVTTKDIKHYEWVSEKFGPNGNSFFKQKGLYVGDTVKPLPGSQDFVECLKQYYGEENIAIISHTQKGQEEEKKAHAFRNFGINRFICAEKKWPWTADGVLIDDKKDNVIDHNLHCRFYYGIVFNYEGEYGWSAKEDSRDLNTAFNYFDLSGKILQRLGE